MIEMGDCEIEGHLNADYLKVGTALEEDSEVLTLTFLGPDDAAGATFVWTGALLTFVPGSIVNDQKLTFTGTIAVFSKPTITADS